jgi:hypothetical protein
MAPVDPALRALLSGPLIAILTLLAFQQKKYGPVGLLSCMDPAGVRARGAKEELCKGD